MPNDSLLLVASIADRAEDLQQIYAYKRLIMGQFLQNSGKEFRFRDCVGKRVAETEEILKGLEEILKVVCFGCRKAPENGVDRLVAEELLLYPSRLFLKPNILN